MRDIEELELMTHTVMDSRCPSSKCADRDVTSSSAELTDEGMSVGRRRALQQLHYGMCRGRSPYIMLLDILDYIVDILRLMLRVVPQPFKHTVAKHCDAAKQQALADWAQAELNIKLSSSKAGDKMSYGNAIKVWEMFFKLYYKITRGCEDSNPLLSRRMQRRRSS
eukprot:jgi/Tetstr1/441672/TSEL_029897.t1